MKHSLGESKGIEREKGSAILFNTANAGVLNGTPLSSIGKI